MLTTTILFAVLIVSCMGIYFLFKSIFEDKSTSNTTKTNPKTAWKKLQDADWENNLFILGMVGYFLIAEWTFVYLTFFDDYIYNWWNWIIVLPINQFLGMIWPIYWLILRPIS